MNRIYSPLQLSTLVEENFLVFQEKENNELRALNRKMEKAQAERAKQYEKELDALNKELEALRRRVGPTICYSLRSNQLA